MLCKRKKKKKPCNQNWNGFQTNLQLWLRAVGWKWLHHADTKPSIWRASPKPHSWSDTFWESCNPADLSVLGELFLLSHLCLLSAISFHHSLINFAPAALLGCFRPLSCLCLCFNLQDVSNNQLTAIPSSFALLVNVVRLNLAWNQLRELPADLSAMRSNSLSSGC